MTRCQGFTSNNRRCRKRLNSKEENLTSLESIFCINHRPKNIDDLIENCPVCCNEIKESKDNIKILKCGHAHHRDCLKIWFDNGKDTCPVCRYKVIKNHPKKNKTQQNYIYQNILYTLSNEVSNSFF